MPSKLSTKRGSLTKPVHVTLPQSPSQTLVDSSLSRDYDTEEELWTTPEMCFKYGFGEYCFVFLLGRY
jgi:hypothetical protein